MCRRNQTFGCCMAAAGLGALLAIVLGGSLLVVLFAVILLVCGVFCAGKR